MIIIMSFKQWRHYLENIFKIKIWSNHINLKWFISQIMLNDCQTCWFIQLTSYDFIIQYCWDTLNSADELSWKLNYMTEQNERHHENDLMLIYFEKSHFQSKKHHKSNLMSICFQEFQLMHENNLMLICSEKSHFQSEKHHESLISW